MNTSTTVNILSKLYKIVEAGEKGYAVAASNVSNRALKLFFSYYAQQRLIFKEEIFSEMQQLGLGAVNRPKDSILATIHRGRIDIFATLTIGAENVEKTVLKEIIIGERVALQAYQKTLRQDLPPTVKALVERQLQEVIKVVDQIRLMRGVNGKRLLLRLYDSKSDAEQTLRILKEGGFSEKEIQMSDFSEITDNDLYKKKRTSTIFETVLSGAAGGATWGTAAGILSLINIAWMALSNPENVAPFDPAFAFFGLLTGGIFVGTVIGLFIGWSISSEHNYISETVKRGEILMQAMIDQSRASKAWKIMNQSALIARARQVRKSPA
jgi:uncharacterized protein (TIGR02284 family)